MFSKKPLCSLHTNASKYLFLPLCRKFNTDRGKITEPGVSHLPECGYPVVSCAGQPQQILYVAVASFKKLARLLQKCKITFTVRLESCGHWYKLKVAMNSSLWTAWPECTIEPTRCVWSVGIRIWLWHPWSQRDRWKLRWTSGTKLRECTQNVHSSLCIHHHESFRNALQDQLKLARREGVLVVKMTDPGYHGNGIIDNHTNTIFLR